MSLNESLIVKCSHCKKILSKKEFSTHKCELQMTGVKNIPVVYFVDTSCNGKKYMTGWGIDGVLYTFEVTPREPIPLILPIRRKKTARKSDTDPTEPKLVIFIWNGKAQKMKTCLVIIKEVNMLCLKFLFVLLRLNLVTWVVE